MRAAFLLLALGACTYGAAPDHRTDYVLIFDRESEALDPAAASLLDRAAAAARAAPELDVSIDGYADAPRSPESNQIRSRLRAQAVANGLLARGIARRRITVRYRRGIGADPGDESRRVELRLGS